MTPSFLTQNWEQFMSKSKAGQVIIRFWIVAFFFALCPYGLLAVLAGVLSFSFIVFAAFVATLLFNFIQWLGHRVLFGGTKEYQELRAKGLDLWFDVSCPWPFRPEDDEMATQEHPASRFYCNNCGAEAFDLEAPCRACGFEQYECPQCGTAVRDQFASCPRCG